MGPLTPEQLAAENQLICTKLLGWEFRPRFGNNPCGLFFPDGRVANGPYAFTTWAEAGLILDAMAEKGREPGLLYYAVEGWAATMTAFTKNVTVYETGPLAIRAAALEYIKELREEEIAHQENLRG